MRRISFFLFIGFIVIQFFQPDKNNNEVDFSNDISNVVPVPDSVELLLHHACYDCHSNNTEYPWYSNIQPVAWWLNGHVKDGKKHLNFNEFATILPRNNKSTKERQQKKLDEVREMIEEDEMPLKSYLIMHKEARLSESEKNMILRWTDSAKAALNKSPEK